MHWRRQWLPTPVFLPGEFHAQRNLAGYSPWWLAEAAASAEGLGCGRVACPQAGEAGAGAVRAGGEEDPLVRPLQCRGSQEQLRDDEVIKDSGAPRRPSGASPARALPSSVRPHPTPWRTSVMNYSLLPLPP